MPNNKHSALPVAASILVSLTLVLVTSASAAPKERLLHIFNNSDGAYPEASLVMDEAGNLYGTTSRGGDAKCSYGGCGVVFELSPSADGKWTETVLHRFHGPDGVYPEGNLIFDTAGNLYGTASYGGENECRGYGGGLPTCGVVFELIRGSNGKWTERVLHKFHGTDGAFPLAGLIFDKKGNLYGTAEGGGKQFCVDVPCGVVFELSPTSGSWTEKVLHRFNYTDGASPSGSLIFGKSGALYGTTGGGGYDGGLVFELKPGGDGRWTENVLYKFTPNHGQGDYGPYCTLILDAEGNLYGTTTFSSGSAFKLTPGSNGEWTETTISNLPDGLWPSAGLTFDSHGNLYGTTQQGGIGLCAESGCGIVFKLTPKGNGSWTEEVVHQFSDMDGDGIEPNAAVIVDSAGNLYGTTSGGGPAGQAGYGVVFELTP